MFERWLRLVGKGSKLGSVALPPMARSAPDRYLIQRRLPTTLSRWYPATALLGSLERDNAGGITAPRLWAVRKRFFAQSAEAIADEHPATADKLRGASQHRMRHTRATYVLRSGVDLTAVRPAFNHQPISNYSADASRSTS